MTVWEQWCEELKECGPELIRKKSFLCDCGIYDMTCTNIVNGKKCPLYGKGCNDFEKSDMYLESPYKAEMEAEDGSN